MEKKAQFLEMIESAIKNSNNPYLKTDWDVGSEPELVVSGMGLRVAISSSSIWPTPESK